MATASGSTGTSAPAPAVEQPSVQQFGSLPWSAGASASSVMPVMQSGLPKTSSIGRAATPAAAATDAWAMKSSAATKATIDLPVPSLDFTQRPLRAVWLPRDAWRRNTVRLRQSRSAGPDRVLRSGTGERDRSRRHGPLAQWWRRLDSNQRRLSQRIYSPSPLTTRALLRNCAGAMRRSVVAATGKNPLPTASALWRLGRAVSTSAPGLFVATHRHRRRGPL